MVSLILNEFNKQIKLFCCSRAFTKTVNTMDESRGGGGVTWDPDPSPWKITRCYMFP